MCCEIVWPFSFDAVEEKVGYLTASDLSRMCPAGVQKRPTCAINRSDDLGVELDRVRCDRCRIVRIGVEESSPAPLESDHLVTLLGDAVDYCFDARIETRNIAPTRENPYTHDVNLRFMTHDT
jgi:hypothetical protein